MRARQVLALAAEGDDRLLRGGWCPICPYLAVEALYAARYEHAVEVEDVLCRRVPLQRLDREQGLGCAPLVAEILAEELGWSPTHAKRSLRNYRALVERSRRWRSDYQHPEPRSDRGGSALSDTPSAKSVTHP